jgi:putative ABC transport system substrate-binding protein
MSRTMRRRSFITLLGGAAAASAWPLAAGAQQGDRVRRIGVLMNLAADDPESLRRVTALAQGLQEFGWTDGRNIQIDYRWGVGNAERYRNYAAELVALAPDVLLAADAPLLAMLQQATRTVPIVFVHTSDPVGGGYVVSLARPGGNATGFMNFEYSIAGKWLELLKQIAPNVTRVAVLRDPSLGAGTSMFAVVQAVAPFLRVEASPVDVREVGEIERAVTAFARPSNGGMVVTTSTQAQIHRELIITLAARHRLPAVYPLRFFTTSGGLICYGPDYVDQYRLVAAYIDRILRGEKPADLPVQAPTKYETVLNLKTARALGLDVPAQVLVRADEVIE